MTVSSRSLALVLCFSCLPALAAPPANCDEVVKQGRSGGFISFESEAHARELLGTEARRYCGQLGEPSLTEVRCGHDAPRKQSVVSAEGGTPLVLERRERWYCSGEIVCSKPVPNCKPVTP
ncbi:hypothetical protein D0B54_08465 [Solimonas sp. K1W22B-7]|uniref:hypothetical protein n=1 Tax=Solimonas sp. K1W22B-7 TaxID=2303331 RepID=UPI000E3351EB|nr:hypothetical protein [Solimonas sp. K1W22B-7]AXQ28711.1 hypothetical protein D0B54_08465 [Solimonas sp. K1W22B-7]